MIRRRKYSNEREWNLLERNGIMRKSAFDESCISVVIVNHYSIRNGELEAIFELLDIER